MDTARAHAVGLQHTAPSSQEQGPASVDMRALQFYSALCHRGK